MQSATQEDHPQGSTGTSSGKRPFIDYPRTGKSGVRRWLPSWRLVLAGVLTGGLLVVGLVVAAYAAITIPAPNTFSRNQATVVRYANNDDGSPGNVMGTFATQQRQIIDATTLPKTVGAAVVASEDSSFYDNSGVDPVGIVRAFVNNIQGGARQGASTITEQYVENYYAPQKATSYVGKLQEALLAVKVNRSQNKDQILGNYLNTIYFGRKTYGIQAAAQAYFNVKASDLTVSQGALLAAVIPSPSRYDPLVDPVKAQELWNRVLDRMVLGGSLTPEDRAKQVFPTDSLQKPVTAQTYQGPRGYLLDMVRTEIKKNTTLTDDDIDTKGLNIVTTIQEQVQTDAEKAVAGLLDGTLAGEKPNPLMKVGLTTIDPADGGIVALYGGPDFIANPGQNTVTQGAAQAGSTFKPFTLVAALENGVSLNKTYNGATPQMFNGWKVGNFGNVPFGDIDLVAATANSVNTVYAQLNLDVGPAKTADVATRAGVRTSKVDTNPANVLGTDTVTPLEMAGAYATFAAKGNRNAPFIVREATKLSDGSVAYRVAAQPEQVFKADVMADATYAMTKVVQEGSGKQWVKPLNRPIAGKTGTSTDNKSAWFIGFTPQLATAVAFYQPQPDGSGNQDVITHFGKGVTQITGGTWPAALWASYMKQVFTLPKYSTVVPFPAAAHVNSKTATPAPVPSSSGSTKPAPATSAAPTTTVPGGLVGSTQADAEAAIVNAGLSAIASSAPDATVAKGRVISASPGVGSSVAPGSTVTIVVSSGPPKTPVTPPPSPSPSRAPVPPVPNP